MTASTRTTVPTVLDQQIEQIVGDLTAFHRDHQAGLLTAERAALASAHRELGIAESAVAYHRTVLASLASGARPVDDALLDRIRRTVNELTEATTARDARHTHAATALETVRASTPPPAPADSELTAHDLAVLLSLVPGGTLRQHLHTHRVSVRTKQAQVVDYAAFQRLEHHGLVVRDTSRGLIVGQPVTLTPAGREALLASRRPAPARPPAAPARLVGSWPASARRR
ncbi:hypothetical protein SLA_7164 [Streptomyces laurentii]|uniref:Uncharacterized protein n=1 Tax=Streptomyces laurentii TaxID=39478 RepID=A0A160PA81_STRLU|nr:hypothetical protein SLA_7164 [Streptomyces laurentii]